MSEKCRTIANPGRPTYMEIYTQTSYGELGALNMPLESSLLYTCLVAFGCYEYLPMSVPKLIDRPNARGIFI